MIKRFKGMSTKNKLITLGVMTILMSGGVFALWSLFYESNETGYIVSSSVPLSFEDDFSMDAYDASSSNTSKIQTLTLTNSDGTIQMNVSVNRTLNDVDDECIQSLEGDVCSSITYEGAPIDSNSIIDVVNGESEIEVTTEIKKFACPSNFSTKITLTPLD